MSRTLEFHVYDASGRKVCSERDAETGDLNLQIQKEEVLRIAELAHHETNVLDSRNGRESVRELDDALLIGRII